jgi:hypothetical protein
MSANRVVLTLLAATFLWAFPGFASEPGAGQQPQTCGESGPSLGDWQFTGTDSKGGAWTGTLKMKELDPAQFDASKYQCECDLEARTEHSGKGVAAPCRYDPAKRVVSFSSSWTANLSPDGRTLTRGTWSESDRDAEGKPVVVTGKWTAKFAGRHEAATCGGEGPAAGKWEFTGKDSTGIAWTGTLKLEGSGPEDLAQGECSCDFNLQSSKSGSGFGGSCKYDPATRVLSFRVGPTGPPEFTAALSRDRRALTQGKWTEKRDFDENGEWKSAIVTGDWTAKFPAP